jgi:hypothetical protein
MFAILHALGMLLVDLFKSRARLEAEIWLLRQKLNIALRLRNRPAQAQFGLNCQTVVERLEGFGSTPGLPYAPLANGSSYRAAASFAASPYQQRRLVNARCA